MHAKGLWYKCQVLHDLNESVFRRQGFEETKDVFRVLMNDKEAGWQSIKWSQIWSEKETVLPFLVLLQRGWCSAS